MKRVVKIAVTGAAGQIGYSLLFRLASGEVFGPETDVELKLLELPEAVKGAEGTAMELVDCAFDRLKSIQCFEKAEQAFDGVHWALLVGSRPRGPGMERGDLIKANGPIFVAQGKALSRADPQLRVIVVGNPCNTNALIAQKNSPDIPPERFSAMTALDENRAKGQLALKACVRAEDIHNMAIWGNHSSTMYPDFEHARIGGQGCESVIKDRSWLETTFITTVQQRGAAIIDMRGKSSAASAASACIDQIKAYSVATPTHDVFSAAVMSQGEYGVPQGLMYSFPLRSDGKGNVHIVQGWELSLFAQAKLKTTADELLKERALIQDLLPH